jgi:hypothetical protein
MKALICAKWGNNLTAGRWPWSSGRVVVCRTLTPHGVTYAHLCAQITTPPKANLGGRLLGIGYSSPSGIGGPCERRKARTLAAMRASSAAWTRSCLADSFEPRSESMAAISGSVWAKVGGTLYGSVTAEYFGQPGFGCASSGDTPAGGAYSKCSAARWDRMRRFSPLRNGSLTPNRGPNTTILAVVP